MPMESNGEPEPNALHSDSLRSSMPEQEDCDEDHNCNQR